MNEQKTQRECSVRCFGRESKQYTVGDRNLGSERCDRCAASFTRPLPASLRSYVNNYVARLPGAPKPA